VTGSAISRKRETERERASEVKREGNGIGAINAIDERKGERESEELKGMGWAGERERQRGVPRNRGIRRERWGEKDRNKCFHLM
jgi:hypothetical protein